MAWNKQGINKISMDKKLINLLLLFSFGFSLFFHSAAFGGRARENENSKNNNTFVLVSYPIVHEHIDSLRVFVYFHIPHSSLQFIKKESAFQAGYEANLSVQDKRGMQKIHRVWKDSVLVEDYSGTMSPRRFVTFMTKFAVIPGEYRLLSDVMDLDTRDIAEYSQDLDLSQYTGEVILYPPIILEDRNGDWGFTKGKIPVLTKAVARSAGEITVHYSGRVQSGNAKIMTVLDSKGEGNLWKHEQSINGEDNNFTLNLTIPDSVLKGIKFSLKAFLIQKNNSVSKSVDFSLKKAGISTFISDISDAIEQMRYILEDDEKLELKNSNRKEREKLFRSFWKKRDPTPNGFQNELMEEYYRRVHYANEHFTSFQPGWKSDMGMIYILFGVPDDVERINSHSERKVFEAWHYLEINRNFTFVDENGFGDFRLQTPYFGY